MNEKMQKKINRYLADAKKKRWLMAAVSVLAVVVAVGTFRALTSPGITLTDGKTLICGKEEHTHTDACYTWELVKDAEGDSGTVSGSNVKNDAAPSSKSTEIKDSSIPDSAEPTQPDAAASTGGTETEKKADASGSTAGETSGATSKTDSGTAETAKSTESTPVKETSGTLDLSSYQYPDTPPAGYHWVHVLTCGKEEHTHTDACYAETDQTSWATVEKKETTVKAARTMRLFSFKMAQPASLSAQSADAVDFSQYITSATVMKKSGSEWVSATSFTDGDDVKVDISYTLPQNAVSSTNRVITYQLPDGIRPESALSGSVESTSGGTEVGSYTIDTNGLITITFNSSFATGDAFTGTIGFQGKASLNDHATAQSVTFGGSGETIQILPNTALTTAKTSTLNGDDSIDYQVTVAAENGTSDTVTIADALQTSLAKYEENSFSIVKKGSDGTSQTVSGYSPYVTTDSDGKQSFSISGLPKLGTGESYVVSYKAQATVPSGTKGDTTIGNSATGSSGSDRQTAWSSVTVPGADSMLRKSGTYDPVTQKINWTITVRPNGTDLTGWTFEDACSVWNEEAQSVTVPSTVTVTDTTANWSASASWATAISWMSGRNDTYQITYQTDVPSEANNTYIRNNVKLNKNGTVQESTYGDVLVSRASAGLEKTFTGYNSNSNIHLYEVKFKRQIKR
jgi:uncharacterized surface anchored protein